MNQQAGTRVPTVESGLTKEPVVKSAPGLQFLKFKSIFTENCQKMLILRKLLTKTDHLDKKTRIFWLTICGK